ncbi:hypothetical protein [Desulforhabdus amnigena]|jgi:hypothetical protein|uniref:Uncharacterized protein n=1 Tax=Desulforhabdus amnigena TaxID=40218 RepID=A0A9W6CZ64_9BACT|nr:hypothetical protein [Desulforhabdus amnigena]NLJ29970.1 hypothetical protein [Deltaproteobacteria bacterium]GLI34486.1 hypothetical protein DAMNIGENAA_19190 [Desulforhabdus amnigena]
MKCNKCGFVSFDYLSECKKCGIDLTVVRDGLGLLPVRPAVPFLLGPLLKEYDEFLGEKNEPADIEDAKPLSAFSESENEEIQFDADMDFTEIAPEEVLQPVASEPVANDPVADVSPEATPEMVLAHDEEPELTIDLQEETLLAMEVPDGIKEGSKESVEDSLTLEMDLGRELEIAPESEPADSVERFQKLPESKEFLDLSLELNDEPESDPEVAKGAERLQKLSDSEGLSDFSLETESPNAMGMEIGDGDLLELVLDDDDLDFFLESENQQYSTGSPDKSEEPHKIKNEIPSIDDINDFVLALMNDTKKKK